jgi:hypothetical protein
MITFYETTDATLNYRETTGICILRTDKTSDTASVLQIIKDSIVTIGTEDKAASTEERPSILGDGI